MPCMCMIPEILAYKSNRCIYAHKIRIHLILRKCKQKILRNNVKHPSSSLGYFVGVGGQKDKHLNMHGVCVSESLGPIITQWKLRSSPGKKVSFPFL